MAFTILDSILILTQDKARFIEHLIEEYPRLLDDWSDKREQQFQKEAKRIALGDAEIEASVLSQMREAFDDNEGCKDMFYKAMLMLVYSYYDGLVSYLTKGLNAKEKIRTFCESRNITLSQEVKQCIEEMDDARIIRNQLVHNNVGNPKHLNDIKRLCSQWDGLHYEDDVIRISDYDYISDRLQKAKFVLEELCKITGHHHKTLKIN